VQSTAVIRALRVVALGGIALMILAGEPKRSGTVLGAQKTQIPSAEQQYPMGKTHEIPDDSVEPPHLGPDRMKAINEDRHKRLQSDVDKMVSLTSQLKTDVDKAEKDELSVEVIRKAQEIEKLAHDVQNRMKN
jgi:hypothetical protein